MEEHEFLGEAYKFSGEVHAFSGEACGMHEFRARCINFGGSI